MGRLKKGGIPDQITAARVVLNDWNNGKIITSICYNSGLEKYLIVMTKAAAGQDYE